MTTVAKKTKNKSNHKPARGVGINTSVFLPEDIHLRLMHYMMERFQGRMHMRNTLILEMIEEKLKKEGF